MKAAVPGLALASAIRRFIGIRIAIAIGVEGIFGAFVASAAAGADLIPAVVSAVGGLIVGVVLTLILGRILLGPTGRAIAEATVWSADHAIRHWRERSGSSWVPQTPAQARRWLAANPQTDRNRSERMSAHLVARDFVAARAEQVTRSAESIPDRVDAALDDWLIEVWVGGEAPLEMGEGLVAQVVDAERRAHALRDLLMLRGMDRAHRGQEWHPPILQLRQVIGSAADGCLWRGFWPAVVAVAAIAYTMGLLGVWLVSGIVR